MSLSSKGRALIYGASTGGQRAYKAYKGTFEIIGFIDIDPEKQGLSKLFSLPVYSPEKSLLVDCDAILIATASVASVRNFYSQSSISVSKLVVVPKGVLVGVSLWVKIIVSLALFYLVSPLILVFILLGG